VLLTALYFAILGFIAFGLRSPFEQRRAALSTVGGFVMGLLIAFFNAYPGSIRGALMLLALSFLLNGLAIGRPYQPAARPLWPRLPMVGGLIIVSLVALAIFPYTAWGADSVKEPIYSDLQVNVITGDAPALTLAEDVRIVPWDIATERLHLGYREDASFLSEDPVLRMRNTYPDTVRGEFIWVHAPAPGTAKWLVGRLTDKVLYAHNDANAETITEINGTLNVHYDAIWWQHRVARYAENEGEFRWILEDVALQLDDDYRPYWIGYLARLDMRSQPHLEKLIVIDAQTGEEQVLELADAPAWVEMVYPERFVYTWADYWGKHREGFLYRWFNADRLMSPDDVTVRYIRLENETYWLLPMAQLSSPQLGGYILIHTRTGEAMFYDRFDDALIDYDTAVAQLSAQMASGTASGGAGLVRLGISEGYLYPIKMHDGSVREAYVFPLTEGLKIERFAVIDAREYTTKRIFSSSMADALNEFSGLTGSAPTDTNATLPDARAITVIDGAVSQGKAIVNLGGTVYRVTPADLALGGRKEAEREFDELEYAIARANRNDLVEIQVRIQGGRVIDVIDPSITWGT
jgi:hypothetical protein